MEHTRCWISRGIAILSLTAATMIAGSGALVVAASWWQANTAQANAPTNQLAFLSRLEESTAAWLNQLLLAHGIVVFASLLLFTLLCLTLLVVELRRLAVAPQLVLSRGTLGAVTIQLDQVGRLAQREAEHVSGVREVTTSASAGRTGIAVRQQIVVEPQVVFAMLATQVQERVKRSLEHHLGLPVNSVQVMLQPTPARKAVI